MKPHICQTVYYSESQLSTITVSLRLQQLSLLAITLRVLHIFCFQGHTFLLSSIQHDKVVFLLHFVLK